MDPNDWTLTGNANTKPGINFLGTTDKKPLVINPSGNVNIGALDGSIPYPKLTATGPDATVNVETAEILRVTRHAVSGVKNHNSAGLFVGAFEPGVLGRSRLDINLAGTPGTANTFGSVPDVTVMTLQASGSVGIGTVAPNQNNALHVHRTASGNAVLGQSDNGTGIVGFGGGPGGPGVRGIGAGGPNTAPPGAVGVYGQAGPGADGLQGVGSGILGGGVHGISQDLEGNGVIGEASNGSNAFAIWGRSTSGFAGVFEGAVVINGPLSVFGGPKSAIVPFPDGSHRRLYSIESPESWFEDFGFAQLVNGQAQVELDPGFAAVVNSDLYHVFITEYDDNNALYVTQRTATGFSVRAASSQTAASEFSYRVVAKRDDIAGPRLEEVTIPAEKLTAAKAKAGGPVPAE